MVPLRARSLIREITPVNAVHGIHVAALSPAPTSASLCPLPKQAPLPSIADADHRGLATNRDLDKMPNRRHLRGAQRCTRSARPHSRPSSKYRPPQMFSSYARSSTSIKDVGAVPADPITNFRPLFLFPPSTNYAGPLSAASPARAIPVTEVNKWQQQPKLQQRQQQRRSRPALASPQKLVPQPDDRRPTRRRSTAPTLDRTPPARAPNRASSAPR